MSRETERVYQGHVLVVRKYIEFKESLFSVLLHKPTQTLGFTPTVLDIPVLRIVISYKLIYHIQR